MLTYNINTSGQPNQDVTTSDAEQNALGSGEELAHVYNGTCPKPFGKFPHAYFCHVYYHCFYNNALLERCVTGHVFDITVEDCLPKFMGKCYRGKNQT